MTTMQALVLLLDKDPDSLGRDLERAGFRIATETLTHDILYNQNRLHPDIVLLGDPLLSREDDKVVKEIKERWNVPTILLRSLENSSRFGPLVDDTIDSPFDIDQLVSLIRKLVPTSPTGTSSGTVRAGDFEIDLKNRLVTRKGEIVPFTRREWHLLEYLAQNNGRLVPSDELLLAVWGPTSNRYDVRVVRGCISTLRHKIERDPANPVIIKTAPGLGYLFDGQVAGSNTSWAPHEKDGVTQLERSIEFPPIYKQAGVAILGQFADIIAREYPDEDISVSIVQHGNILTLRIVRPTGAIQEIARRLDEYGKVIREQMPIETFTTDRDLVRDLRTTLEIVKLELRLKETFYLEFRTEKDKQVLSLEDQVASLRSIVLAGLSQSKVLSEIVQSISSRNILSDEVINAMTKIGQLSGQEYSEENVHDLRNAVELVRTKNPTIYAKLLEHVSSMPFGIASNLATPWVQQFFEELLKRAST